MSLWDEPVPDVRALCAVERDMLIRFLAGVTEEEWLAPTAAPPWTVKDIALHLLDDDLTWLSRERDGEVSGLVDMSDRHAFPQLLAEKNQRWVDAAGVMSRRVVIDLLQWSGQQVDALHAARDLLGEGRVSWASDEPVPYWFNLAQEFTERWIHQQQIREAVGRVEDHETSLPEVLETFVWAFPHQLGAVTDVHAVEIAIDTIGVWTVTAGDEAGWSFATGTVPNPDARLRLTADGGRRMLTGAETPAGAFAVEGNTTIADELRRVRAVIV
jgi:uncharacterized damage-inducible protein DinB